MKDSLLIIGAGQYGAVAMEVAESMGCFEKIGFLDDNSEKALGKLDRYQDLAGEYTYAFVAIGKNSFRMEWLKKLKAAGYKIHPLISPHAHVSPTARIGAGSIIEPMAVVQPNAYVGKGCLICACAVIKHNSHVSDGCHIDSNAVVIPRAVVPAFTKVACGKVFE
jgi:UDP-3-O-[3-hydroxymyristoyl] glucosamine N-acyltransferase